MKRFFVTFLAVITAQVFLGVLCILILIGFASVAMMDSGGKEKMPEYGYLHQKIPSTMPEFVPESSLPLPDTPISHTAILENLEKAAVDDRVAGIVLEADLLQIGWAKLSELRDRIALVQSAGKPVYLYSTMASNKVYFLGAACDSIFLHPQGFLTLGGIGGESFHNKKLLDKLGVKMQVSQIKEYKAMAEMMTRTDMSPEARENAIWILEEIYDGLLSTLAVDRGIPRQRVEDWFATSQFDAITATEAGIIDGPMFWESLADRLYGTGGAPKFIDGDDYTEVTRASLSLRGKRIAVIHGEGLIAAGESGFVFPFGASLGDETLIGALQDALDDRSVKGILLRFDTGGGMTTASDRIREMVKTACAEKPVVISMVDVTASGGYMASYPCETLVASPMSIVGSIGSINMRGNLSGLLEKFGVTVDKVSVGPHPDILSAFSSLDDEEFARLETLHWDMYNRWIADIAAHRGMTAEEVDNIARGRVFTGTQALGHGLIDELGGFDHALGLLKAQIGVEADEPVSYLHLPIQKNIFEKLLEGDFSSAAASLTGRGTKAQAADQTLDFWTRSLQEREPLSLLWWRF
jgi:protease IV